MAKNDFKSIDEYIAAFPEDVQDKLEEIRAVIRKEVPDAVETISYGMPAFNLDDRYLVYFAGWKRHISLYPVPLGNKAFQAEALPYLSGKGTAKFPLDKPIPFDLITRIVKFRVKENQEKQRKT